MERRTFIWTLIGGSAAGVVGVGTPAEAAPLTSLSKDAAERVARRAATLLQAMEGVEARTRMELASRLPQASRSSPALADLAGGLGGMIAFEELLETPVEEQAHPAFQQVGCEGFRRTGAGSLAARSVLEAARTRCSAEELHTLLAGALGHMNEQLSAPAISPRTRERLAGVIHRIRARLDDRGAANVVDDILEQFARMEKIAVRMAAVHGDTGLLEPADPAIAVRVRTAAESWRAAGATGLSDAVFPTQQPLADTTAGGILEIILGILLVGGGVALGYLVLSVAADLLACFCVGIVLILLAMAIAIGAVALGIFAIVDGAEGL